MSGTLSDAAFLAWGWRVAFWLSAVVIVIGYYVRTRVSDAPIYEEAKAEIRPRAPRATASSRCIKRYPRGVLTGMGLRFAENILYYLVVSFSIVYLGTALGMDTTGILGIVAAAHAFHFVVILVVGRLADSIGRKPLYVAGAVLGATWCWFAFPAHGHPEHVVHPRRAHGRPALPRPDVRGAARDHGGDVPDPDALLRRLDQLPGHLHRGRFPRPDPGHDLAQGHGLLVADRGLHAIAATITLVAALALRETRGASLHDLDAEDQARERALAGKGD